MAKHIIDCDADPFIPAPEQGVGHLQPISHKKRGLLELDFSDIELYISPNMKKYLNRRDKLIRGEEIWQELEEKDALNANVLHYLLARPELVPAEWHGKLVCFWGTIYSVVSAPSILVVLAHQWGTKVGKRLNSIATYHDFVPQWPAAILVKK